MTRPGIEPRSPGPLANTLPTRRDRTLGSNGNGGVLHIPQSSLAGASPYIPDTHLWGLTPPQKCSRCILQLQLTGLSIGMGWQERIKRIHPVSMLWLWYFRMSCILKIWCGEVQLTLKKKKYNLIDSLLKNPLTKSVSWREFYWTCLDHFRLFNKENIEE